MTKGYLLRESRLYQDYRGGSPAIFTLDLAVGVNYEVAHFILNFQLLTAQ
jgi:hypothetical protein